jgi:DNA mismatch repair protein MutL
VVPSIDFDQEGAVDIPIVTNPENVRPPQTNFNPSYNPFNSSSYKRPSFDWEKLYGGFENEKPKTGITDFEIEPEQETDELPAQEFVTVEPVFQEEPQQQEMQLGDAQSANFQFKNRYIITGVKSGMLLIDQHRAHIRILFEEFLLGMKQHKTPSQQLLFPESLQLNTEEKLWFAQIEESLRSVGFDFENESSENVMVNGVPSHFHSQTVVPLLHNLLENARHSATDSADSIHEMIALSLAEASALKSGQTLSAAEMSDLIDRLFACSDPNRTPDGKTITVILSQDEIAGRFR